jgi:hypothetical protein
MAHYLPEVFMHKIFRIGHRTPNHGVITIASSIKDERIYYGVSFCSPKEKQYDKKKGMNFALTDLLDNLLNCNSLHLIEQKHSLVINTIILDILTKHAHPDWAFELLQEQFYYPTGLVRYSSTKKVNNDINLKSIIVEDEFTKQQLILASEYLNNCPYIDDDFMAVNVLSSLYAQDYLIVVKPDEFN